MSRCRICGRPPAEECCTRCHAVEAHLRHDAKEVKDDQVNTEEVNQ